MVLKETSYSICVHRADIKTNLKKFKNLFKLQVYRYLMYFSKNFYLKKFVPLFSLAKSFFFNKFETNIKHFLCYKVPAFYCIQIHVQTYCDSLSINQAYKLILFQLFINGKQQAFIIHP